MNKTKEFAKFGMSSKYLYSHYITLHVTVGTVTLLTATCEFIAQCCTH